MKKMDGMSKSLGLTQEQLAMLLGITRSRVSLFELGLRPLPAPAAQRLKEILLVGPAAEETSGKRQPAKANEQHTLMFTELLKQNASQQQQVTSKILELQEKHSKGLKGQALLDYLATTAENKEQPPFLFMPPKSRNANYIVKTGQFQKMKYEIQLKVLKYEEQLLREVVGEGR